MRTLLMTMIKSLALGVALVAALTLSQGVARADAVTYSTSGQFNGGGNTIIFGGGANTLTLTFTGVAPSTVNANPTTFASFGTIKTSTTGSGATITAGTTLTLNIVQVSPTSGSGFVAGTLTGTISQNSSSGQITFNVLSTTINGVTYSVVNNPLALVPPSTNNGNTTVQGQITAAPVPEPATLFLLGTGLSGMAALARKRRKARQRDTDD